MRRYICTILSIILCAAASACGDTATPPVEAPAAEATPQIVMFGGTAQEEAAASTPKNTPLPTPTSAPEPETFSLRFVGDLMCCEYQMKAAIREDGSYDFVPPFNVIREELAAADCTIGNLETNFYPDKPYHGTKKGFNAPESYLDAIKDCGFDVLVTANNHALDLNAAGAITTIEAVRERGMDPVGTYTSEDQIDDIYIRDIKGVKVAFLAYATRSNKQKAWFGDDKETDALWVLNFYAQDKLERNIADARAQGAQVIVLYFHAGYEKTEAPSSEQRRILDACCEAGADVVIMSHTHSLLPMETRTVGEGENARTVYCAYGMGNFMSSALPEEALNNIIVNVDITYDFAENRIEKVVPTYLLTYTFNYYENGELQFEIVPMEQGLYDFSGVVQHDTRKGRKALESAYNKMIKRIGEDSAQSVYSFLTARPEGTPVPTNTPVPQD